MANIVQMEPVTRVEGHSKLVLETNDDGIVEKGNYFSITPVRNFEKFLIGKPMEFATTCNVTNMRHLSYNSFMCFSRSNRRLP